MGTPLLHSDRILPSAEPKYPCARIELYCKTVALWGYDLSVAEVLLR